MGYNNGVWSGSRKLVRPFCKPDFIVRSNDTGFLKKLEDYYGVCCVKNSGDICDDSNNVTVTLGDTEDLYKVSFRGEQLTTDFPLNSLASILFAHTVYDNNILALHGGAVSYNKKAFVFLASTTSGKTTLTAYLCDQGFRYLTDDCVLIDRETLQVYSHPEPVHLREGGLNVLKEYKWGGNTHICGDKGDYRYAYSPKNIVPMSEPEPLGGIYFITRTPESRIHSVTPMTANSAISSLLAAPITPYPMSSAYIRLVTRIYQSVPCMELMYDDMNYVKEIIMAGGKL